MEGSHPLDAAAHAAKRRERMMKCNQICPWNYYERGCLKPHQEVCPLDNTANQKKLKTNADRIRAMTDEELLNILSAPCPLLRRVDDKGCPNPKPCRECIAEWLKQTAEEET